MSCHRGKNKTRNSDFIFPNSWIFRDYGTNLNFSKHMFKTVGSLFLHYTRNDEGNGSSPVWSWKRLPEVALVLEAIKVPYWFWGDRITVKFYSFLPFKDSRWMAVSYQVAKQLPFGPSGRRRHRRDDRGVTGREHIAIWKARSELPLLLLHAA